MIRLAFPGENPLPLSKIPPNDPQQARADGGRVLRIHFCVHDGFLMATANIWEQTEDSWLFGSSEFESYF